MSQDFPTIVWRLKELGFNSIRLPFSFRHFQVHSHMEPALANSILRSAVANFTSYDLLVKRMPSMRPHLRQMYAMRYMAHGIWRPSVMPVLWTCRTLQPSTPRTAHRQAIMLSGAAWCPGCFPSSSCPSMACPTMTLPAYQAASATSPCPARAHALGISGCGSCLCHHSARVMSLIYVMHEPSADHIKDVNWL